MKKFLFAIAAMMVSTFGFAQGFGGPMGGFGGGEVNPEEIAQRQVDRIAEGLDLTKDQKDSLLVFYTAQQKEQMERMQKMRESGEQMGQGGPSEDMMKEMQARREAQEKKIKSILTEEQYEKYQKAQAERRERMMQNGGGFGG
ncbi:MAG: hypothetical protein MJY65_01450, partial [Bacteroidaceae bacterium]|nr:hypothetical protein [Bacteroidaceae bacterium]